MMESCFIFLLLLFGVASSTQHRDGSQNVDEELYRRFVDLEHKLMTEIERVQNYFNGYLKQIDDNILDVERRINQVPRDRYLRNEELKDEWKKKQEQANEIVNQKFLSQSKERMALEQKLSEQSQKQKELEISFTSLKKKFTDESKKSMALEKKVSDLNKKLMEESNERLALEKKLSAESKKQREVENSLEKLEKKMVNVTRRQLQDNLDLKKKLLDGSKEQLALKYKFSDESKKLRKIENSLENLEKKFNDDSKKQLDLEKKLSDASQKQLGIKTSLEESKKIEEEIYKQMKWLNHADGDVMVSIPGRKYVLVRKEKSHKEADKLCRHKYKTRLASFNSLTQAMQLQAELKLIGEKYEYYKRVWTGGYKKEQIGSALIMGFLDGTKWPVDICTMIGCYLTEDCRITEKATEYYGNISVSRSGNECQKWSSQFPVSHGFKSRIKRIELDLRENYCRNPSTYVAPWCYIIKEGIRWELCDIPRCNTDCQTTYNGKEYIGNISVTYTGKTCQRWSSQTPHKHGYKIGDHNYCRNPEGKFVGPICYTTDPMTEWEYCSIPFCPRFWTMEHPKTDHGNSVLANYISSAYALVVDHGSGWFLCNYE